MNLEKLLDVVRRGKIIRSRLDLLPAGGDGSVVTPPTYPPPEGRGVKNAGPSIVEFPRVMGDGAQVPCVQLNSNAAEANRMEEALFDWAVSHPDTFKLPYFKAEFWVEMNGDGGAVTVASTAGPGSCGTRRRFRTTSLHAPHRAVDAWFRSCSRGGKAFAKTEIGRALRAASLDNATSLFRYAPTALIFGMWDSHANGIGLKVARAIVSEIFGVNSVRAQEGAGRVDPIPVSSSVTLYVAADQSTCEWTVDPKLAKLDEKRKPMVVGKEGRPSAYGLGNIPPGIQPGGVSIERAVRSTYIDTRVLGKLEFPVDEKCDSARDDIARAVLVALALCAVQMSHEAGYHLRSGCALVPSAKHEFRILADFDNGIEEEGFALTAETCAALLTEAVAAATSAGLPWEAEPVVWDVPEPVVQLVEQSLLAYGKGKEEE